MYSDSVRAFLKPITPFLDDPSVLEVVVNGPREVWVERGGRIVRTDAQFSEEGLLAACRNIAQFVGRVLNEERPRLDARLPDGSRIHIILEPMARKGAILAIRKFMRESMPLRRLVDLSTLSPALARLLDAAIQLHLNIIVAGGTGSGKTSLLNVLSGCISNDERVVTIEDSAELQLQQSNVISLESRPPDKFGKGEVTLADLLNSALRLRPDRIIVGEARGGECFSLIQAMNTGHTGSMATTHANTPVDTLRRLETLCLMSGIELPLMATRGQVASAVNLVICLARYPDGTRKLTHVSEVLPLDDRGEYRVQDLFVYQQTGRDPKTQAVVGHFVPTGVVPTFFARLGPAGIDLPETFFDPAAHALESPTIFSADLGPKTRWVPSYRARMAGQPAPEVPRWVEAPPKPKPATVPPHRPPPPKPPPSKRDEPTIQVSEELLNDDSTPVGVKPVPPEDATDPQFRAK
jgi:pilus assembly protein CpaF